MIYEIYVIDFASGIPYIDNTYRKVHLGVSNTLVSGLLHVVFTMFNTEMEIGHIKSMTTQDYKLIYLKHRKLLFISLADIKLNESKIQKMLNSIATSFYDDFGVILEDWTDEIGIFEPFTSKLDVIVIGTIIDLFFEKYPANIVSLVDYISQNYTLEYQQLIGNGLAKKILVNRFSNSVNKRNLKKELSKFTVVQKLTDDTIELSVCPFCRKKESKVPLCNFVVGFINGMLQSDEWVERTCCGLGDARCSFSKK